MPHYARGPIFFREYLNVKVPDAKSRLCEMEIIHLDTDTDEQSIRCFIESATNVPVDSFDSYICGLERIGVASYASRASLMMAMIRLSEKTYKNRRFWRINKLIPRTIDVPSDVCRFENCSNVKRKSGDLGDDVSGRSLKAPKTGFSFLEKHCRERGNDKQPPSQLPNIQVAVVKYTISEDRSGDFMDEKARLLAGLRQKPGFLFSAAKGRLLPTC